MTKPLLKWVGGKSQSLPQLLDLLPTEVDDYLEPFLGGGSLLLAVLDRVRSGALRLRGAVRASDLNPNLIHFYRNVQQHPDAFLQEAEAVASEFNEVRGAEVNREAGGRSEATGSRESYYFWVRREFNLLSDPERESPKGSAMFFFLNKTCFRGLYREGPSGFNVPFGNYKTPFRVDADHVRQVSSLLRDVSFSVRDFRDVLGAARPGDFLFLDPPYAPLKGSSFTDYTRGGFDPQTHQDLFRLCARLRENRVPFLLCNADVPLVRAAFPEPDYDLRRISCRRAIHSRRPGSTAWELLIRAAGA